MCVCVLQHVTGTLRNISFDEAAGRGVGSACTLVAEAFLEKASSLLDPPLATMLLGECAAPAAPPPRGGRGPPGGGRPGRRRG
ncbi:MAG: hypothetical protein P4L40_24630, partial [Terracidiphilus sp.]|nr:hypothetical protein [Terracidiphilus sp.]